MTKTVTAPFMHATDVDTNDDYAMELAGVDRERGLFVLNAKGEEIRFSLEMQEALHENLGLFLQTVS